MVYIAADVANERRSFEKDQIAMILAAEAPDLFSLKPAPSYPEGVPVEVCVLFERLTLRVHDAGLTRFSARAVLHQIRWYHMVERRNGEFAINNKFSAPLARWFLANHPELPDFFETRGGDE